MILSIESDLPTFKPVTFRPGANVLLSHKSAGSNERKTRNSAGKSSTVELLHFLLGSSARDHVAAHEKLAGCVFYGTFLLGGRKVQVGRTASDASKIFISPEDAQAVGASTKTDKQRGSYVTNEAWKEVLGHKFFGLPFPLSGTAYNNSYSPSFRSLVSYFARRRGGFLRPQATSQQQQPWDTQVALSYLLGLDWSIPSALEQVRQQERHLGELKKAAKGGAVGELIGTVAELRPKIVRLEADTERLQANIAEFRVLDTYKEWSDRAATLRGEMLELEREKLLLKQSLDHLRRVLADERPPQETEVDRLYKAVGVQLPDTAVRRFGEVVAFHQSVITNRRMRLEAEVADTEQRIAAADGLTAARDEERSGILRHLSDYGAFEDLVSLQTQLSSKQAELAALRERYKAAEVLEGKKTELEIDRANIKRRLQEDHQAREKKLDRGILLVGQAIERLYDDRSGAFEIGAKDNGPTFEIKIAGDRGGGISQIEIFCLDLALYKSSNAEHRGPGLLVHDSHLFDGVDERQVAQALVLGKEAAEELRGQYIVTLNSDVYDRLPLPPSFDRTGSVCPTVLSDADERAGLFGFRFD